MMTEKQNGDTNSERMARLEVQIAFLSETMTDIKRSLEDKRNDNDAIAKSTREAIANLQASIDSKQEKLESDISRNGVRIAVIQAVGTISLMALASMIGSGIIKIKFESANLEPPKLPTERSFGGDH